MIAQQARALENHNYFPSLIPKINASFPPLLYLNASEICV